MSLLKAYITTLTVDITCLSEPNLDSSTQPHDNNLDKPGYKLVLSDYPSNNRNGGVCI